MRYRPYPRIVIGFIVLMVLLFSLNNSGAALSPSDGKNTANDAALKLVRFCFDPKAGFDEQTVSTLVDHILRVKQAPESGLPKSMGSTGAYYEFDIKTTLPRLVDYAYNRLIPQVITRPSSLRHSEWRAPAGEMQELPASWEGLGHGGKPVIIHGIQLDSNTPDLSTGVYHEQEMKRTLILLNHKGRQVMISVSKQIGTSKVGKKGAIIGEDTDWNYYYSGQAGATIAGFGWAKSYIYDYFSVAVFVESTTSSATVRSGVFQWLRAGWSGINFVKESHILTGMRRFGRDFKAVLESPRLPAYHQMTSIYHGLSNKSDGELTKEYSNLLQAQRSLALQAGKISRAEGEKKLSLAGISRDQMVEELMLERLKSTLGKPTLLGK